MPFEFVDLFAGIGGIRIAFEAAGGDCVFSSEYNAFSQKTYKTFFGVSPDFSEILLTDPPGDITKIPPELIPNHDVLVGGFPCQPFSLAGVSKKQSMGRPHGFEDPTQGTLFFNVKRIIEEKRPKAFLLENVKNLITHDSRRTFKIIVDTLNELDYSLYYRIIDAKGWVPQHRERIYIVGFRNPSGDQKWKIDNFDELNMLRPPVDGPPLKLQEILEPVVPEKYTLTEGTWAALQRHREYHQAAGRGFGYGIITNPVDDKITRTLSARYYKDGGEILLEQPGKRPRRLTPLECCRLMGFPQNYQKYYERDSPFVQPVSDLQAYKQFGNSVVVPVVTEVAKLVINKLTLSGAIT